MEKENIRKDIISRVQTLNDERILNDLLQILQFENNENLQLSKELENDISEGVKDLESGHAFSHMQVKEAFEKWRKK